MKHGIRDYEVASRKNALRAARMVISEGITQEEAARHCESNDASVSDALFLLLNGTPEQIAEADTAESSLRALVNALRKSIPKEQRKRPPQGKSKETEATRKAEAAMWAQLRTAIDIINGLPKPADVAAMAKKNGRRTERLNDDLIKAYSWITEFSDAWTK